MTVKWVDTNKGTPEDMMVRSLLVARDCKGDEKGRDDLFAGTPQLEAKRLSLSRAATKRKDLKSRKLLFIDVFVKRAVIPSARWMSTSTSWRNVNVLRVCGKLIHWSYGFRPASAAWEKMYSGKLEEVGFVRGDSCAVVFYHPNRDISLAVHGDDFTACGVQEDLDWIKSLMEVWFEIEVREVLGWEEGGLKEITLLGRVIRWTEKGIEYEADPGHRKMVLNYFGLGEQSRESVSTNGEKEAEDQPGDEIELDSKEATEVRAIAAGVNYMSLDCPDLQFPIKQCSREMAKPVKGS